MNIALIGYGKMGREIETIALQRGHTIIHRFDIDNPLPRATSEIFSEKKIDAFIDFSIPSSVRQNIETASVLHIPLVEGTTGWYEHKNEILEMVKKNNGSLVYGNNYSVGAQIFFRLVRRLGRFMNAFPQYDIGIHETHHNQKKDAPSGTALTAANLLLSAIDRKTSIQTDFKNGEILPEELSVSSARVGKVFGTHTILCHSGTDEIEITHRAHSRSGFAFGAVLAAEIIQTLPGIFTFEELVFEKTIHL